MKQWVRNRVVEINSFTQPKDWMFVTSEDMIADIATRPVSDLDVVSKDSVWINGFDWTKGDKASFPAKKTDEIKLNSEEISALEDETLLKHSSEMAEGLMANKVGKSFLISDVDNYQRKIPSEVLECYKFSKYVVDQNKARFKKVVRIFAFVLRFIKKLQKKLTICQST